MMKYFKMCYLRRKLSYKTVCILMKSVAVLLVVRKVLLVLKGIDKSQFCRELFIGENEEVRYFK